MRTVHLMGIGGSAMVSLAGMFLERGWSVRGSDAKVYPPASDELKRLGVKVFEGFDGRNLEPAPDLVVVGNVVSRSNPEAQALLESTIPYLSMPGALREHFLSGRSPLVVAGTHGKTTCTSLLAWIFESAGRSPGFFVGGIPNNFGKGFQLGSGNAFVLEGDEYDTAFFEKTPKFLHYRPQHLLLTSVEFDHADIYRDLAHVMEQFEKLLRLLPVSGNVVACGDWENVQKACAARVSGAVTYYGLGTGNAWRAENVAVTETGTRFDVTNDGKRKLTVESPLLGEHNVVNALGCLVLANALGVSFEDAASGLRSFRGVRQRQEFVGEEAGVRIYDDFAHHPTAIAGTLAAFEPMARARKGALWAVFEPRSNTVRRRVFQNVLPESFRRADRVVLAPVYTKPDALTANDLLQPGDVALAIAERGGNARAASSPDEIVRLIEVEARRGDVIVFMSNGNFGGIPLRVKDALSRRR